MPIATLFANSFQRGVGVMKSLNQGVLSDTEVRMMSSLTQTDQLVYMLDKSGLTVPIQDLVDAGVAITLRTLMDRMTAESASSAKGPAKWSGIFHGRHEHKIGQFDVFVGVDS